MVELVIVNTYKKYAYKMHLSTGDAIKYLTRLYYVPPQARRVCVVHVNTFDTYDDFAVSRISTLISSMLPDKETIDKYRTYKVYDR